ncbi:arsenite methyltransferase [Cellulomonas sp.]|uniref:arsenite methyltransferase n=1 Tax=Cellulomonas sp. TaxID=40001 RepID=UPI0028118D4E|nr:arsenite methyltransferase [Cellulomonas sp.]
MNTSASTHEVHETVRRRYAAVATATATGADPADGPATDGGCCGGTGGCGGTGCCGGTGGCGSGAGPTFGAGLYDASDLVGLPRTAVGASLGCGDPTAVADLRPGERVLDLGSGAGIDALLSARRVGPTGFVHGVDMTDEMLALARANAAEARATNVAFHRGTIEDLPLPDACVDVVVSNCVVNLSPDKDAVLAEAHRVLVPGGRLGISDVVAEDRLTPADRAARGSHVGCVAGALSSGEYTAALTRAGFVEVRVEPTHAVADGMHAAVVRAVKPRP